jgi:DNA-binding transcriptional ArsR family regulator
MSPKTSTTKSAGSAELCCGTPEDNELATLARGLGHPLRVTILRTLLEVGDCLCGELVAAIPRAQSTVSQHLKILKETGLVVGEVDGPRVCYCANRESVARFQELVNRFEIKNQGGCK